MSVASGLGLQPEVVAATLASTKAAFGRVETLELHGRTIYLLLVKNPAGFTQVIETFLVGRKNPQVLMAINDLDADGRDVSWLWDVPLEALVSSYPTIYTGGTRGADMALRLHYAGLESRGSETLEMAVTELIEGTPEGGTAYILPSYTAMLEIRKSLARKVPMQKVWS